MKTKALILITFLCSCFSAFATPAPDFNFKLASGDMLSLHDSVAHPNDSVTNPLTLLIFYNSDCAECLSDLDILAQQTGLNLAILRGQVNVVAVDPYGNEDLWREQEITLPSFWTVGFDCSDILDNDLYDFSVPPAFFLIDHHQNIINTCSLQDIIARYH